MNTDISLVYLLYKVLQLNSNIETDNSEISNHLLVKIFISQGYTQVDAELLCIEKNALEELYIKVPKFERFFRHLLQNAFVALQERIVANLSQLADERYCTFINKYPDMEKRLPLKRKNETGMADHRF